MRLKLISLVVLLLSGCACDQTRTVSSKVSAPEVQCEKTFQLQWEPAQDNLIKQYRVYWGPQSDQVSFNVYNFSTASLEFNKSKPSACFDIYQSEFPNFYSEGQACFQVAASYIESGVEVKSDRSAIICSNF